MDLVDLALLADVETSGRTKNKETDCMLRTQRMEGSGGFSWFFFDYLSKFPLNGRGAIL